MHSQVMSGVQARCFTACGSTRTSRPVGGLGHVYLPTNLPQHVLLLTSVRCLSMHTQILVEETGKGPSECRPDAAPQLQRFCTDGWQT